jgi:molecular chaperone DnaK
LNCQQPCRLRLTCHISRQMQPDRNIGVDTDRAKIEQLTSDLISRSLEPVRNALRDAGLKTVI